MSTIDHLIRMANQIARELGTQQRPRAVAATGEHLRRYWDPRMRAQIIEYLDGGGEHLSDIARGAVALLRENAERAD